MTSPSQHAVEFQGKYELYLVTLVFTVVGLAVQAAKFDYSSNLSILSELAAWIALLSSGILGVWRLQWVTPQLHRNDAMNAKERTIDELETLVAAGQTTYLINNQVQAIAPFLSKIKGEFHRLKEAFDKSNRRLRLGFFWQLRLLIAGLIGLMFARGIDIATWTFRYMF